MNILFEIGSRGHISSLVKTSHSCLSNRQKKVAVDKKSTSSRQKKKNITCCAVFILQLSCPAFILKLGSILWGSCNRNTAVHTNSRAEIKKLFAFHIQFSLEQSSAASFRFLLEEHCSLFCLEVSLF